MRLTYLAATFLDQTPIHVLEKRKLLQTGERAQLDNDSREDLRMTAVYASQEPKLEINL
jgi:hypothetical protein